MEHFEKELSFIKNDEIREKTKRIIDEINPCFYEVGASSTGKYHPSYALGFEGLYRHTCAAVRIAEDLMSLEHNAKIFDGDTHDYVIAALILHDSCKCGRNWTSRYTIHEHPTEAAAFIQAVIDGNDEKYEVSSYVGIVGSLVASHMGQWNIDRRSRKILPKPTTIAQQMVHVADYLASRKYLEFVFDDEVVELKENSREIIKEVMNND